MVKNLDIWSNAAGRPSLPAGKAPTGKALTGLTTLKHSEGTGLDDVITIVLVYPE